MSSREIKLAFGTIYDVVTARTPEDAHGPGILVLYPKGYDQNTIIQNTKLYAAEGYNCISLITDNSDEDAINSLINKVKSVESLVGQIAVIAFGQASVLAQIGALDPEGLPIVGAQAAEKLMDESLPSNELMGDAWTNISG